MDTISCTAGLPRSTPEREGISSEAILNFLDAVQAHGLELHSFMMLRHGHVIAEGWWYPYHSKRPHMLFSMTKSFTAMGVGFAITEGLFALEDPVSTFFPEIKAEQSCEHRQIQIRDLLTMSVGHVRPTMGGTLRQLEGSWIKHFFEIPVETEPGTCFMYNTIASHLLSVVIQRTSGVTMADYLKPRLFTPLGIFDFTWDVSPEGHTTGASGLNLETEDIAKFGQFIMQKGRWEGRQLLPESWIEAATSCQIATGSHLDSDACQGYGYQFWRCRHGAVRADGAFGQLCVICPEQDAVIVTTAGVPRSSDILDAIWTHLLPEMKRDSLLVNDCAQECLNNYLESLALVDPGFMKESSMEAQVSGKTYTIQQNVYGILEASIAFEPDSCLVKLRDSHGKHEIRCGRKHWIDGTTMMTAHLLDPKFQPTLAIVARAAWRNANELVVQVQFVEAPFSTTIIFWFEGNQVQINFVVNTDRGFVRPVLFGSTS